MPEPLDDIEKAYFDTILNGGRPDGGVKLTLLRMQTVEGDPVAVVCAVVHGTPLGDDEGYQPLAILLTDPEQVKHLLTVDGRGPEVADPADFATGLDIDPRGPDLSEEILIPIGHRVASPFEQNDDGFVATCECGVILRDANDAILLEKVIAHWEASR